MTVGVVDEDGLARAVAAAHEVADDVLLERCHHGADLRIVVIGGEVVAASERRPPAGHRRRTHGPWPSSSSSSASPRARETARRGGSHARRPHAGRGRAPPAHSLDDVLPDGVELMVRRTANVHTGGTIDDVTDELHPELACGGGAGRGRPRHPRRRARPDRAVARRHRVRDHRGQRAARTRQPRARDRPSSASSTCCSPTDAAHAGPRRPTPACEGADRRGLALWRPWTQAEPRPQVPLAGVTVLELGGIGPLPLLAMLFADMGARIIRVDPAGPAYGTIGAHLWIYRGHESVTIDLRQPRGQELVLQLVERADILVEGYRPGVAERLGVGPDVCLARNPRLVYGRMTGWGQGGPLSDQGGHDINYIGLTGALEAMGPPDAPPPVPLNLVGDFGGGAMMLAMGVLAALHEREQSGAGSGRRGGDVRRHARAHGAVLRDARRRPLGRRARRQPAAGVRTLLPLLRDERRPVHGRRRGGGQVLRRAARRSRLRSRAGRHAARPRAVARAHAGVRGGVPCAHARRVGGRVRDARRVRHAGAEHDRGARAPAQRGARLLRRRQRPPAGRAAGALRAHAGVDRRTVAGRGRRQRPRARRRSGSTPTSWRGCAPTASSDEASDDERRTRGTT